MTSGFTRRVPCAVGSWVFGIAVAASLMGSCAPRQPLLPSGAGAPFPDFPSAYRQATAACEQIKTITATFALAGRAGSSKLRGRIDAGFAPPARARLEGIAPFGKPVFILVADGERGTLVLPREDRVLRDAPPDRIVEALAGVPLGPQALRTAVSGCGLDGASPAEGQSFSNGWVSGASGDSTVYLRQENGAWRVAAATRGPVTITYADYVAGRPSTIRFRAESQGRTTTDLTVRLSNVDLNTTLDPRTFEVDLPEHPVTLTLEELRRAGPLGGGGL